MGQESRWNLPVCLCLGVSHRAIDLVSARCTVSSEGSTGVRSAHLWYREPQVPIGCWLEASCGSFCVGFTGYSGCVSCLTTEWASERGLSKREAAVSSWSNHGSDIPSLCHILFFRISPYGQFTPKRRDYTRVWMPWGGNPWGPYQMLPTILITFSNYLKHAMWK